MARSHTDTSYSRYPAYFALCHYSCSLICPGGPTLKAFISHSSKDKAYVDAIVETLRPGSYELDSDTFDLGLINTEAITNSLARSDLFCLILSTSSINSTYVDFETLLGIEFVARGSIHRFLAICVDDTAFEQASVHVKFFNLVRKIASPEAAGRLIQGQLVSAVALQSEQTHPFIGREDEIRNLGRQVNDHTRSFCKALYISGNFGSGRRTLARNFYNQYFPQVNRIFPTIHLEEFDGLEELYHSVLAALRPSLPATKLLTMAIGFQAASPEEKSRLIAQQLNALLTTREAAYVLDKGGVLTDAGAMLPEVESVLANLDARPHPPIVFISPRMVPKRFYRREQDVSYIALTSLSPAATEELISHLLRAGGIDVSAGSLEELIQLSDAHPFNIYTMLEAVAECGVDTFLANPTSFIEWKHRQSSEYLGKIKFGEEEKKVLGILKLLPQLDFGSIIEALNLNEALTSDALLRMLSLHIVEGANDSFMLSPALRIAVERDKRFRLADSLQRSALLTLADSLSIRLEGGTAPIVLINSAVLASLQSGGGLSNIAAGFLLPSHQVWMAKKCYDNRAWHDCIKFSRKAIEGKNRLSSEGMVGACRYLCLASARVGKQDAFGEGMKMLESIASNNWANSNVAFLKGFNARLKGHLPIAEDLFRTAYDLSPGNFAAAREIASACLERGNLKDAEKFAREAQQIAQRNQHVVDILVAVLIRQNEALGKANNLELDDLFNLLREVGEQDGRSFYTTRRAEYELKVRNYGEALRLIKLAVGRTPSLFEPRRLHAQILLEQGNKTKAAEAVRVMRDMVSSNKPDERRKNYRQYLETYSSYLTDVGKFSEAKTLFDDEQVFAKEEREGAIRRIEIVQGLVEARSV